MVTPIYCASKVCKRLFVQLKTHTRLPSAVAISGLLLLFTSAANAASPPPQNQICVGLPNQLVNFDELSEDKMREWLPSLQYAINSQHLSIGNLLTDNPIIRQRFIPTANGSDRVIANIAIEPGATYELRQSLMFETGFDWGGVSEGGKVGFGLGGGSLPSGGNQSTDGFTVRLIWDGNHDGTAALGAYVYSANRSQNLPYGDEYITEDFTIPIDVWFDVNLVVTMNTSPELANGSLAVWVNNEVILWRENIQWQGAGETINVDTLLYSSFYGGNSSAWAPDHTTYARVTNICYSRY